jgi:hypothetical protein
MTFNIVMVHQSPYGSPGLEGIRDVTSVFDLEECFKGLEWSNMGLADSWQRLREASVEFNYVAYLCAPAPASAVSCVLMLKNGHEVTEDDVKGDTQPELPISAVHTMGTVDGQFSHEGTKMPAVLMMQRGEGEGGAYASIVRSMENGALQNSGFKGMKYMAWKNSVKSRLAEKFAGRPNRHEARIEMLETYVPSQYGPGHFYDSLSDRAMPSGVEAFDESEEVLEDEVFYTHREVVHLLLSDDTNLALAEAYFWKVFDEKYARATDEELADFQRLKQEPGQDIDSYNQALNKYLILMTNKKGTGGGEHGHIAQLLQDPSRKFKQGLLPHFKAHLELVTAGWTFEQGTRDRYVRECKKKEDRDEQARRGQVAAMASMGLDYSDYSSSFRVPGHQIRTPAGTMHLDGLQQKCPYHPQGRHTLGDCKWGGGGRVQHDAPAPARSALRLPAPVKYPALAAPGPVAAAVKTPLPGSMNPGKPFAAGANRGVRVPRGPCQHCGGPHDDEAYCYIFSPDRVKPEHANWAPTGDRYTKAHWTLWNERRRLVGLPEIVDRREPRVAFTQPLEDNDELGVGYDVEEHGAQYGFGAFMVAVETGVSVVPVETYDDNGKRTMLQQRGCISWADDDDGGESGVGRDVLRGRKLVIRRVF